MTQNQNPSGLQQILKLFNSWYKICALLLCVAAVLAGLGYAVEQGAITPQQAQGLINDLAAKLNQRVDAINATLITSWQDTIGDPSFYTTQQPYAYVISSVSGYYCLQNGTTGYLQAYSPDRTTVEQWALGNTTSGTICLKEVQWNTALTLSTGVLVIQQWQGTITYYNNQYPNGFTNLNPQEDYNYLVYSFTNATGTFYQAKNGTDGTIAFTSTNPRTVIQDALNIAGSTVYVTNGIYTFTDGTAAYNGNYALILYGSEKLIGESRSGVIFTQSNGAHINTFITSAGYAYSGIPANMDNITLSTFTIQGNWEGQTYSSNPAVDATCAQGIKGYGNNWLVENLVINDIGEYAGVEMQGSNNIVQNCVVTNLHARNAQFDAAFYVTFAFAGAQNNIYLNDRFSNIDGNGFRIEDNSVNTRVLNCNGYNVTQDLILIINGGQNQILGGNFTLAGGHGVQIVQATSGTKYATSNNTISNAYFSNMNLTGFRIFASSYNTFSNNYVFNAGINTTAFDDTYVDFLGTTTANSSYNILAGNHFDGAGNTYSQYAIDEHDGAYEDYNNIVGNTVFDGTWTYGVARIAGSHTTGASNIGIANIVTKYISVTATNGTTAYLYWKTATYLINTDGNNAIFDLTLPPDFTTLKSATIQWVGLTSTPSMAFNVDCEWRLPGDLANAHEGIINVTQTTTANTFYSNNISSALSGVVAGDIIGIQVSRLASGNTYAAFVTVIIGYT